MPAGARRARRGLPDELHVRAAEIAEELGLARDRQGRGNLVALPDRPPVWSLGSVPVGPLGGRAGPADRLLRARIGDVMVSPDDLVVADDDGILFLAAGEAEEVFRIAAEIVAAERAQAERLATGGSLREQLGFDVYMKRRRSDPAYDFRRHLRESGGAIET